MDRILFPGCQPKYLHAQLGTWLFRSQFPFINQVHWRSLCMYPEVGIANVCLLKLNLEMTWKINIGFRISYCYTISIAIEFKKYEASIWQWKLVFLYRIFFFFGCEIIIQLFNSVIPHYCTVSRIMQSCFSTKHC